MKKKILFVIPSLRGGGAEKSLVTLLSVFDCSRYDVSLLSFRRDGIFWDDIPKNIRVIGGTQNYELFDGDAKKCIKSFLKRGKLAAAFDRIKYSRCGSVIDDYLREKEMWRLLKKQLPQLDEKFDCVIGYLEGTASFYACEYLNADKRIVYVHSDIKKLGLNEKICIEVFDRADNIVTVSDECAKSLKSSFPTYEKKLSVIENITSPSFIAARAGSDGRKIFSEDFPVVLTVGRLAPPKGIDIAVRCCAELKKRGRNIKWFHIGGGDLRAEIESLISGLELENDFILLGEKSNPYPYMAGCDIYVQPSRYEGKSIAIDEVKCLCRPIVVTDFTTVADQISDGENGLICRMDENDMADKIEILLDDPQLRQALTDRLKNEKKGNEDEAKKLYALIDA